MEYSSIPLAFLAGILSLLSPCVLPMLPAVAASSMQASRAGLFFLAMGLSISFALGGTLFTYLLLSMNVSTEVLRHFSSALMMLIALTLLNARIGDFFSYGLSKMISSFNLSSNNSVGSAGQFLIGSSLGLVWLPCIGPTLGAAIALASTGNNMMFAFSVMLSFGIGVSIPLVLIGHFSSARFGKLKISAVYGKRVLGWALLVLALLIITNIDRKLERIALEILPSWLYSI